MDVYSIVIECENTGKATRTGCELSDISEFKFIGLQPQTAVCEHRHEIHTWTQQDAWIVRQIASRVRAAADKP